MSNLRLITRPLPALKNQLRRLGRSVLVAALLGGGLLAGEALALGLGQMTVHSRLGANFDGEVALLASPEESRQVTECFRLARSNSAEDGLPALTRGTVVVERKNGLPVLLIRSSQPINEPVLVINLHAGCGAEVVREYTVLLDAPPTVADKPAAVPSNRRAAAESEIAKPAEAGQSTSANGVDSYPAQWNIADGDSAWSITRQLFPRQPKAQRRFLAALRQSNPDLDFGEDGDVPLAIGQVIRIPDTRRSRASRDTAHPAAMSSREELKQLSPKQPEQSRQRAESARVAARSDGMTDRLSLSASVPDGDVEADEWSLRLSTELSYDKVNTTTDSQRNVLRLEYKLLASIYDQANQQLALAEQVRQLEASVAELRTVTERSLVAEPSPTSASGTDDRANTTSIPRANEPTRQRAIETDANSGNTWYWLAAALLLILFLAYFFRRYASRASQDANVGLPDEVEALPAFAESAENSSESSALHSSSATLPPRAAELLPFSGGQDNGPAPVTIASELSATSATALVEHYEFDPVMELAEIMLAFGRVKGATEALEEYIETHPTGAVQPWMKLIDIYWQNSLRGEYESLAPRFQAHFNVQPADWQAIPDVSPSPLLDGNEADASIDQLLARTPNVAALPAFRETIAKYWVASLLPEAHALLNTLLHERKNSLYEGLSLSMVNEILFLLAVIEVRLEKTAARNA